LAVARSKGILFYLLTLNVLIGFFGCLMLIFLMKTEHDFYCKRWSENARHQADGKPIFLMFLANKKEYSYGHYWDCGYRKLLFTKKKQ